MEALLVAIAALVVLWAALVVGLVAFGRGTAARELAALLPNLARLFRALLADPRVPLRAKVALGAGAAYLVFPIDVVPDFIPVAGSLDDAIVAALVLRFVLKTSGREVVAEHWRGDPRTLDAILRIARA